MNTSTNLSTVHPLQILDRHAMRRAGRIPTVSLLAGPTSIGIAQWRRWVHQNHGRVVVAPNHQFPLSAWIQNLAEVVDLPQAALSHLAERTGNSPETWCTLWRSKTGAEQEMFWNNVPPLPEDRVLRPLLAYANAPHRSAQLAESLSPFGDAVLPILMRLVPPKFWPALLFQANSSEELSRIAATASNWTIRLPELPVAVATPAPVWEAFLSHASESRSKTLLREGEIRLAIWDRETLLKKLQDMGVQGTAPKVLTEIDVDSSLVETTCHAIQATAEPPKTTTEADLARSAAEQFLFHFLESLPETSGRFELNASLDFKFGPRAMEIDLLCRSLKIAIEIDGYFHFLHPESYRRDRAKDWELQRRGYFILRFLAEDVIPHLEMIRDRILEALHTAASGASP